MRKIWLGLAVFLGTVCSISKATFQVGMCEDGYAVVRCTCGEDKDDFEVLVKVKRCKYLCVITTFCIPCEEPDPDDVCPRYKSCKKCHKYGGNSCETCPDNKTGKWCQRTCDCLNGGTCDRKGNCVCPPDFEGKYCRNKVCYCQNGGTCDRRGNCVCPPDFEGKYCQNKASCQDPGPIENGKSDPIGLIDNVFYVGTFIQYSCQGEHYLNGEKSIFCTSNGTWSAKKPECIKASCQDPGPIENGKSDPIGLIDNVFYVGTSIQYSCQGEHYLNGEKSISCTSNGTWSAKKPECIKVDACENLPIPTVGSVMYSPPRKTVSARRSPNHRSRSRSNPKVSRLPKNIKIPKHTKAEIALTPAPMTVPLPPGLHREGTTATYDCESRYYELIGSHSRTCLKNGVWSGRPPMCMPVCGQVSSSPIPFIVHGNPTAIEQSPWQVGISFYYVEYEKWILSCGGSLLNEEWVITAAHCVTYNATNIIIEHDKMKVYMGKYYREDSGDDDYVQVRKVRDIHIHPDYDSFMLEADIALIQLDSPVHLNARVQPICLPTSQTTENNLVEGNLGVVTGWGNDETGKLSEKLQQTLLPFVSQANCEKGYEESNLIYTVTDSMFCAGYATGGSDACLGDSGSPMVFIDSTSQERKRWVLEGIVSWGGEGCGNPKQYSGFTQVSRFLDWIHTYF